MSIGGANVLKPFPYLVALSLLVALLMLSGCNASSPTNPGIVPTSTLGLSLPSKTSDSAGQASIVKTATTTIDIATSAPFCYDVPEPQLIKPKDGSSNIYLSGSFYLCRYTKNSFDMDSGSLGHTDSFGNMDTALTDVEFRVKASTLDSNEVGYFILGVNGAYITDSDMDIPTIEHCQSQMTTLPSDGGILLVFSETNISGCVLTNEGRLGYIKVEHVDPLGPEGLEVSFVTWNKE